MRSRDGAGLMRWSGDLGGAVLAFALEVGIVLGLVVAAFVIAAIVIAAT